MIYRKKTFKEKVKEQQMEGDLNRDQRKNKD